MIKRTIPILLCILFVFCGCSTDETGPYVNSNAVPGGDVVVLTINQDTLNYKGVQIEIKNLTDRKVTYETKFVLEQKTDEGWKWINKEQEFTSIGCILAPNDTNTQNLTFTDTLDDGEYRITKQFHQNSVTYQYECSVEFELI